MTNLLLGLYVLPLDLNRILGVALFLATPKERQTIFFDRILVE